MQVLSIDDFAFKDGTYLNRLYFNPEMTEMTALENLPDPLSSLRQLQDPPPLITITRHTKASNSRLDCCRHLLFTKTERRESDNDDDDEQKVSRTQHLLQSILGWHRFGRGFRLPIIGSRRRFV